MRKIIPAFQDGMLRHPTQLDRSSVSQDSGPDQANLGCCRRIFEYRIGKIAPLTGRRHEEREPDASAAP